MSEWHKTSCVLCAQNCGLEVRVENNRMVKVRPDQDNPRSEGYVCRKGLNVAFHQHHSQRLNHPLKKVNGKFQRISWDQAIGEISEKLRSIVDTDFPAIMGTFPPNVLPEEIRSGRPERLRAVLCSQSNPLRSYADTTAYELAFAQLDLLVTCEVAMTETAALSPKF